MSKYTEIEALNSQAILQEVEGDSDLLQELITLFLTDGQTRIQEIEAAASSSDVDTVRRAAHALKGSAAVFGHTPFHRLAHAIEFSAREGNLAAARELSKDLDEAFKNLSHSLSDALKQIAISPRE